MSFLFPKVDTPPVQPAPPLPRRSAESVAASADATRRAYGRSGYGTTILTGGFADEEKGGNTQSYTAIQKLLGGGAA